MSCTFDSDQCIPGTSFKVHYSELIVNHAIIGPVLKTLNARDHNECKDACFMNVPDECYMFNYYSQDKKCELLYKDRLSDYKVVKRNGSAFKTRKCKINSCQNGGQCYSLGEASHEACICKQGFDRNSCEIKNQQNETDTEVTTASTTLTAGTTTTVPPTLPGNVSAIKASTAPICIGAKGDAFGKIIITKDGLIKSFKLVHISGSLKSASNHFAGNWGSGSYSRNFPPKIAIHITDDDNFRITPPENYTLDRPDTRMGYDLTGYSYNSDVLVLPNISPTMMVMVGDEFRIWYGEDLKNVWEADNSGQTCAEVYVLYTEFF